MKTRIWLAVLCIVVVAAFMSQPVLAQEASCCADRQVKGEASCCGNGQNDTVQEVQTPNQEKCPVMGGSINKEVYADYNGKRVYFCCAGCDKTFQKDPEKYMKKMQEEGVVLEASPCPVSGKPAKAEIFTEYQGKKVYFCCEGCKKTFLESPEKYLKKS